MGVRRNLAVLVGHCKAGQLPSDVHTSPLVRNIALRYKEEEALRGNIGEKFDLTNTR